MYNLFENLASVIRYVANKVITITYAECLDIYYGARIYNVGSYACVLSDDHAFIEKINNTIDDEYVDIKFEAYERQRIYDLIVIDYNYILHGKTSAIELYNNLCVTGYSVVILVTPNIADIDIITNYGKTLDDYGTLLGRNVHISYLITPNPNNDDVNIMNPIKMNSNVMDGLRFCINFPIKKFDSSYF